MLNRAAFFATMVAGAGLSVAALLGQAETVEAAPQPEAEMVQVLDHAPLGWHRVQEGDQDKLAYGISGTDQILVMLSCRAGDQAVEVFGLTDPDVESVRLVSASAAAAIEVEPVVDEMSGSMAVETRLPTASAVMQGFRDTGRLMMTAGNGREMPVHAVQAEQAEVRAFFDHCDNRNI